MKLKYSFETVDMGDEVVAVPVGQGADIVRGVLKLNKEGCTILNLLKEETSEPLIVDALSKEYENDREILTKYVRDFIHSLKEYDLISD